MNTHITTIVLLGSLAVRKAFGKCVSEKAKQKQAEADQRDQEQIERRHNAAKKCDKQRGDTTESRAAFVEAYGRGRNAFGKCVSQNARS